MEAVGRVAVVTGSARGIGRATAERLGRECAVVVADLDAAGAEQAAAELRAAGQQAVAMQVDVSRGRASKLSLRKSSAGSGDWTSW